MKPVNLIAFFITSLILIITSGISNTSSAHTPDRCFHTHYGGNTNCKRGIVKKACSNAKGEKGRCYQSGSHCYCNLYPKKDRSAE